MKDMNKNVAQKQRFSIRKYRFGAASVLLATVFALGMQTTTVHAYVVPSLYPASESGQDGKPGTNGQDGKPGTNGQDGKPGTNG
ncbi:YSIRK-type signal peptide-containing protein, partial [Streptococcus pyogenes]